MIPEKLFEDGREPHDKLLTAEPPVRREIAANLDRTTEGNDMADLIVNNI